MSSSDVKAALGSPTSVQSFANEPGPIWSYQVTNVIPTTPGDRQVFDIHFGADGRVATANEALMEPVSSGD